ncbi:MAG: sulfatase-like hydrolase/transferase [Planctomycetes bacterium]|nr:sulfatase-like hydrolase/transferase [Planctomycetota bacterium]
MKPPNIVLVQSDQHRADLVGVNGGAVKTPNLDRLAAEGVNFANAYCPVPLCGPARTSLLTGQWSHRHGSLTNWDGQGWKRLPAGVATYASVLRGAGYFLSYLSKWHVDPDLKPADYGFHRSWAEYDFEKDYESWRAAEGLPPRAVSDKWFSEVTMDFGFVDKGVDPLQSRLGWAASRALEALEECASRDEPFFFAWNPPEPHFPCAVPEPYASMYPPADLAPWGNFADPLADKPFIHAQMRRTWATESVPWEAWAPHVARYMGEISLLDAQVGRLLDGIDSLGLAENTLVVYTADHGDMTGGHGMLDKHNIMYDEVVRVPLIARWPGVIHPGSVCDSFVSSALDLAATFCSAAGSKTPESFDGDSLLPLLDGKPAGRNDIFCEYHGNHLGLISQRMLRNRRLKYVWNATDTDELYDLEQDPGEVHNLVHDASRRQELAEMRARLLQWMKDTRDPLANSWIAMQLTGGRK